LNCEMLGQDLSPAWVIEADYKTLKSESWLWPFDVTVNDEVVYFLQKQFGFDKTIRDQLKTWGEAILPIYQALIVDEEYIPFEAKFGQIAETFPADNFQLVTEIVNATGIPQQEVWNYLSALESLAKGGAIDLKHYDPRKKDLKTVTAQSTIDALTKNLPSPTIIYQDAKEFGNKYLNAILGVTIVTGAIGGLFYIDRFFNKRRTKIINRRH